MTKRLKTILLSVMSGLFAICFAVGLIGLYPIVARADSSANAASAKYSTVAVHDPSIVLAYEDADGNTYPEGGSGRTKVYYVFGTQFSQAKSYDLVNWTSFTNNLNIAANAYAMLSKEAAYSGLTQETIIQNCWAPDVIWNEVMGKWCMYLSVNGEMQCSSIVMLTADRLDGAWSYGGAVTYSRITNSNIASTDYTKVTGDSTVDAKYSVYRNSAKNLLYGVNAIDASVTYDENGDLWMSYGSWFGGIYLLKLDETTGLRDYTYTYENNTDGTIENNGSFTVYSDEYLGIHIAGGLHSNVGGEGSYLLKIGDWWYLFLSYGGYAPDGNYNMRVFRSDSIAGPYTDAAGNSAVISDTGLQPDGTVGNRIMSGYTWSWWDYSYISQGHNSAFIDDDGNAYLVYHNKYTDGTEFHVLKAHQLLVNTDGWLVTSPFEAVSTDAVATGLSAEEIAGTYGAINMTNNNGTYSNVCREAAVMFSADGSVSGAVSGTWAYTSETGAVTLTIGDVSYNGYLMYQNLEGTNIRTLVFTAVSTEGSSVSQYTYWGYRYPTQETAAYFAANMFAVPNRADMTVLRDVSSESTLWHDIELSLTLTESGYSGTASSGGQVVATTTYPIGAVQGAGNSVEYDVISAGQYQLPLVLSGDTISISFDYSGYSDDWTEIFTGSNFRINLGVLEYNTSATAVTLFENQATAGAYSQFASEPYQAFFTTETARATIMLNSDGSISFYRDGVFVYKYEASTKFNEGDGQNNSSYTVADMNESIKSGLRYGTIVCSYDLENVAIKAENTGNNGMGIELSDETISLISTYAGNTSGLSVRAIPNAVSDGVAVSFYLSEAVAQGGDWAALAITTSKDLRVTVPNIDIFFNTAGLAQTNIYPSHVGGDHTKFLNTTCYLTISIDSVNGICYYQNGVLALQYAVGDGKTMTNGTTTVASVVNELLTEIQSDGFTFAGGITAQSLILTNALSVEQAASVYADYVQYTGDQHTEMDITLTDSSIGLITTYADNASGTVIGAIPDATTKGVAVSFQLTETFTDGWASHVLTQSGINVTLACLDPYNSTATSGTYTFPNKYNCAIGGGNALFANQIGFVTVSIRTDGYITFYLNGEKKGEYTPDIKFFVFPDASDQSGRTVKQFVDCMLGLYSENGFVFGSGIKAKDLILTYALSDTQAANVYQDYLSYGEWDCDRDGHQYAETSRTGDVCNGFTVTYTCSECKDSYTEQVWDGVVGHKYAETSRTEATCGEVGSAVYTCSVCGDSYTVTLPATGEHSYSEQWYSDGENHWHKCTVCGAEGDVAAHSWNGGEVTKEATCTEAGEMTYTCSVCGETKTEAIGAKGHTPEEIAAVAPTCTTEGSTAGSKCSVCGEILVAPETIPALGHTFGTWSVTQIPTEESEGALTGVCSVCHETESIALPVLSDESYRVESVAATCTEAGSKTYFYTHEEVEYEVATITLAALGHSFGEWSLTKAPTATATGTLTRTCERDGSHTETFALPMLNETDYTYEVTKAATCTETGTATYTYEKDGQSILAATVTLTALGHQYSDEWMTDGENHWHECTVCGDKTDVESHGGGTATCHTKAVCDVCGAEYGEFDPNNHAGGTEIRNAKPATETETGYTGDTYCLGCGALLKEGEEIPVLDHTHSMEYHAAVAATCTQDGMEEYWECTKCNKYYADSEGIREIADLSELVIPAAHTWGEWTVTADPTADETGTIERECSVCHDKETDTPPVLNSSDYSYKVVAPSTCSQAGSATYTYKNNTSIVISVELPLAAHTFGGWSVTQIPTEESEGALTRVCSVCHETESISLPVLSDESYRVESVAATCTEAGSKTYFYTHEEVEYEVATITLAALGHSFGEWSLTKAPTATATGTLTRTCERDGSHTETFALPMLNETDYTYEVTKAATCTETGTATYTYEKDGQSILAATVTLTALGHQYSDEWMTDGENHWHECTVCGDKTDVAAHSWNGGEVTKEATCTEAGEMTYTCTVCGETKTEAIGAKGHTPEEIAAVAPTCTTEGSTAGSKCSVCGEILVAPETIPALGHSFGEWSVTKAPTATEAGTLTRTCERDGSHTETFALPMLNETDYTYEVTKAATCTETGTATYTYEKDGQSILVATVTLTALGHSWGEWTVTKEPTYTEKGTESRTCSVCNETETRDIPAIGLAAKFKAEVEALGDANTREEKFEAISLALTTYGELTDSEREEVAEEYATLETEITAYNASAQAVNDELVSATEIALKIIVSTVATMSALAAAWFVVKKLF